MSEYKNEKEHYEGSGTQPMNEEKKRDLRDFFVLDITKLAKALDYFFIAHQMSKKSPQELKEITAIFYNAFRDDHVANEIYDGLYNAAREFEGFFNLHSFRKYLQERIRPRYRRYYKTSYNPHTGNQSYIIRDEIALEYGLSSQIGSREFMKTLAVKMEGELPFLSLFSEYGKKVNMLEGKTTDVDEEKK